MSTSERTIVSGGPWFVGRSSYDITNCHKSANRPHARSAQELAGRICAQTIAFGRLRLLERRQATRTIRLRTDELASPTQAHPMHHAGAYSIVKELLRVHLYSLHQ